MKIFVTGEKGRIGKALLKVGFQPLACDDVTDENAVLRAIGRSNPDLIVHLAGKSDPDWCEKHHEAAAKVNFWGTHWVMKACVNNDIPVVYLSSAQVWGGGWRDFLNKHAETSRPTMPVNTYGSQKMAAEAVVHTSNMNGRTSSKIVRTSYIFNRERLAVDLKKLRLGLPVDAPRFLKRSFLHMDDFIVLLTEYCKRFQDMPPVLHLAGSKTVSYYEFWREVAKQFGYSRKLVKGRWIEKSIYPARRPHNGGLDVSLSQSLGFPSFDYIGGIERMKNE
jgi:dTDP-4-dehydrorhamnose reductase